jgi:hypothetical protein
MAYRTDKFVLENAQRYMPLSCLAADKATGGLKVMSGPMWVGRFAVLMECSE